VKRDSFVVGKIRSDERIRGIGAQTRRPVLSQCSAERD